MIRKKLAGILVFALVLGVLSPAVFADGAGGLVLPISDKLLELDMWTARIGLYRGDDYNDKASFQEMEKRTNIRINFELSAGTAYEEQFNLLMASRDLPDLILAQGWNVNASTYGQQGALLPIDQYLEYMPNFSRILEEYPEIRGQVTAADGHIYYMPNLALDGRVLVQMFPQIRKDWLANLG